MSLHMQNIATTDKPFFIVGIGSSAGGLKALEDFFSHCPSDTGFAFVIIQHLSPDYKSLMPELLARRTEMKVTEAKQGDFVKPNHVYLIPGKNNLELQNGKLEFTSRSPKSQINYSIDTFFYSLAKEQKEKAIAIILSGTGSDGTKGAKVIKETGGTIFVQNPKTSDFDGMPYSVINQGLADFILDPQDIAEELVGYVAHQNYLSPHFQFNDEQALNEILKILKKQTGYDFFDYKKPTLLRRTAKRINITKCNNAENYINYLRENPEEKHLLTQEYLINVTKFFRDEKAFEILKKEVIPSIVESKLKEEIIKIWVVACATGEEAYSIAILFDQYLKSKNLENEFKIFATDLDEKAIEVATKGIFNTNIESEIPKEILDVYFKKTDNKYLIHPSIRKKIIFSKHDVLVNPPFNKVDLVTCRNMLIYLEPNIQGKVLSCLHYALNLNGYMFLGSSENIGYLEKNFDEISSKWKIYQNVLRSSASRINRTNTWRIEDDRLIKQTKNDNPRSLKDKINEHITQTILENLKAVSVCINENFEIIHAKGNLKKYMNYPEEGFSNNLLRILPDELNIPISTGVRKLVSSNEASIQREVKYIHNNTFKHLLIITSPFSVGSFTSKCYLITITEVQERKVTEKEEREIMAQSEITNRDQVIELKEALNETRENLQTTIEELETSNEEMQATNEEILASNEELQSTNEELQSLNEELHTVNSELQEKNDQLIELNSDVENLMKNINVGTLFLDKRFNIRKFTPSIKPHFPLRLEDVGRSISHFKGALDGENLVKYAKKVIKTLLPHKQELLASDGKWYTMGIYPYRTEEDAIQGVVVNFTDVDTLKKTASQKEDLNSFLSHLMKYNPSIIYIYDLTKKENIYCSANIYELAGYSTDEISKLGNELFHKIIHPDDLDKVYIHHQKLGTLKVDEIAQIQYRLIHKKTGDNVWILSSDKLHETDLKGNVKTILGSASIITKTKETELKLQQSEERFRLAVNSNQSALWEWKDITTDQAWFSEELLELLGRSKNEMRPYFSTFLNAIHPEHLPNFEKTLEKHIESEESFEEEILVNTKNNSYNWFRINGLVKKSKSNQNTKKVTGTLVNINHKKNSEKKLRELNVELERFAYLASHDLKEPLKTISSFSKLLKEEYSNQLQGDGNQYLGFIEEATTRMLNLTNDLLNYSKLKNKSLQFTTVDLNNVLNEVKLNLHNSITQTNANIYSDLLPTIICNESQIKQLFQNLLSNSLKYIETNSKPNIVINYIENSTSHEIKITDNGIGIPRKHHSEIFEVFKRLHRTDEFEGTGIGLANCKRIVENHQGTIWVESEEGKGTTFYFKIPKKVIAYEHSN